MSLDTAQARQIPSNCDLNAQYEAKEGKEAILGVLTKKEQEIANMLVDGFSQEEIAEQFKCSRANISQIVANMRKKVNNLTR